MKFFRVGMCIPNSDIRTIYYCVAEDQATADQFIADKFIMSRPETYTIFDPDTEIARLQDSLNEVVPDLTLANKAYNEINRTILHLIDLKIQASGEDKAYQAYFVCRKKMKRVALLAKSLEHARELIEGTGLECLDLRLRQIDIPKRIAFYNQQLKRAKTHVEMLRVKIDNYRDIIREINKLKEASSNAK